jgi:hypothetical protein
MSACGAAVEAIHDAFDQDNLALGRCCELRAVRPKQASRAVGLAVTTGGDVLSGHPLRAINLSTDPADMGSRNVRRIDRCRRSQQVGCRADSDDEGDRQKKRLQRQLAII